MLPNFRSRLRNQFATTLTALILLLVTVSSTAQTDSANTGNPLMYALAWKQTSAEYRALYHQGFNIARMHVQNALANQQPGDKPLAVVTDMDDTVLHALNYWGYLVNQDLDFFSDPIWDTWVAENGITAAPGAAEFLEFCATNGVEVFYVTSRDQGDASFDIALANLRHVGFPYADAEHLTVLRETSNKEARQDEIMQDFTVAVFLGDNLNDFRRKYYIRGDVEGRIEAMEADREKFGSEYVLFPNPTDGHWLAAIFGESEPPPSAANREILRQAAARSAWQPD